jgi:hypothetical protein
VSAAVEYATAKHVREPDALKVARAIERIRSRECVRCGAQLGSHNVAGFTAERGTNRSAYCDRHAADQRRARLVAMTPAQLLAELERKATGRLSGRQALARLQGRRQRLSGREALAILDQRIRVQNAYRLRMIQLRARAAL